MPFGLISFLFAQVIWVCMRLIGLPALLSNVYYHTIFGPGREYLQIYLHCSCFFLCHLLLLHFYWMFLFLKMDYMAIFKGEARDIQNDVTKMKGA